MSSVSAQNIVPNPNFSEHWGCPDGLGEIDSCKYWYSPTLGTVDYYNSCSDTTVNFFAHVPNNLLGYQESNSNAYTAIVTYAEGSPWYREYLTTSIPALEIGAQYRVTVNVSLADSVKYATDGFGAFFYINAKPDSSNDYCITNSPQIDYTSYGIITDKINWTKLTSTFIADSAYTHLSIGNFKCGTTTHTYVTSDYGINAGAVITAYYYIDSVSVEKIASSGITVISNNSKISIYPNPATDKITIEAPSNEINKVELYNVAGQLLSTTTINNEQKVSLSLPACTGIILAKVYTSEGVITTRFLTSH